MSESAPAPAEAWIDPPFCNITVPRVELVPLFELGEPVVEDTEDIVPFPNHDDCCYRKNYSFGTREIFFKVKHLTFRCFGHFHCDKL